MLIDKKLDIVIDTKINNNNIIDLYSTISNKNNKIEKLNLELTTHSLIDDTKENKNKLIEKLNDEFAITKENLRDSIEINMTALRTISNTLSNTPHDSKIGEVLARLLESMTDLNQQYLNSSKQYIEIIKSISNIETEKESKNENKINIQNAAIFSGTLQDLIRSIPQNPI